MNFDNFRNLTALQDIDDALLLISTAISLPTKIDLRNREDFIDLLQNISKVEVSTSQDLAVIQLDALDALMISSISPTIISKAIQIAQTVTSQIFLPEPEVIDPSVTRSAVNVVNSLIPGNNLGIKFIINSYSINQ